MVTFCPNFSSKYWKLKSETTLVGKLSFGCKHPKKGCFLDVFRFIVSKYQSIIVKISQKLLARPPKLCLSSQKSEIFSPSFLPGKSSGTGQLLLFLRVYDRPGDEWWAEIKLIALPQLGDPSCLVTRAVQRWGLDSTRMKYVKNKLIAQNLFLFEQKTENWTYSIFPGFFDCFVEGFTRRNSYGLSKDIPLIRHTSVCFCCYFNFWQFWLFFCIFSLYYFLLSSFLFPNFRNVLAFFGRDNKVWFLHKILVTGTYGTTYLINHKLWQKLAVSFQNGKWGKVIDCSLLSCSRRSFQKHS